CIDLPFRNALYLLAHQVHPPETCEYRVVDGLTVLYSSPQYPLDQKHPSTANDRFTVRARNANIRLVLNSLFASARFNYVIDQGIQGTVTIDLRNRTLKDALESILRKVANAFTVSVQSGVYCIAPKVLTHID